MIKYIFYRLFLVSSLACLLVITGCSSKHSVNFKIHSEPEGAHVIYRQDNQPWIYLGVTPLNVVEVLDEDNMEEENTVSFKALRCGYLEQVKEWNGEELLEEIDKKDIIFWTPRLIKNSE